MERLYQTRCAPVVNSAVVPASPATNTTTSDDVFLADAAQSAHADADDEVNVQYEVTHL